MGGLEIFGNQNSNHTVPNIILGWHCSIFNTRQRCDVSQYFKITDFEFEPQSILYYLHNGSKATVCTWNSRDISKIHFDIGTTYGNYMGLFEGKVQSFF